MQSVDFAAVLSSALTPITLISGVSLLLMTMSARYVQAACRVRELLHAKETSAGINLEIDRFIRRNFRRTELLRKAILCVALSAASAGLLVLSCTLEAMFGADLFVVKHVFLLACLGLIVASTLYFLFEVSISLRSIGLRIQR